MTDEGFLPVFLFFIRAGSASPRRVCDWWEGFSWSGLAVICWLSRVTDVLSGRRTGQGLEIINPFMKVRQGERETGSAALFFSTVPRPDDRNLAIVTGTVQLCPAAKVKTFQHATHQIYFSIF